MINRKISDTQLVQPVHSLAQMQAELAAMRLEQVVTQLKHLEALQDQGNHQMQDSENLDTLSGACSLPSSLSPCPAVVLHRMTEDHMDIGAGVLEARATGTPPLRVSANGGRSGVPRCWGFPPPSRKIHIVFR